MKEIGIRFGVLLVLLILVLGISGCTESNDGGTSGSEDITWLDYEKGMETSTMMNKPVMIDFYTDWCYWCKELDKNTYSDAKVQEKAKEFVSIKVDGDARGDLVEQYDVDAYPTIVFLDSSGSVVHRVVGYKDADAFLKDMETALEGS